MSEGKRYIGRIASVPGDEGYGFISIGSVTMEDGSPHDLDTESDVFLHQDDCRAGLIVGTEVSFEVAPARRRERAFRAVGAVEFVEVEAIPANEPAVPGFSLVRQAGQRQAGLAVPEPRLPVHANMKDVPAATVAKVIENAPLPNIPRVSMESPMDMATRAGLLQEFLALLFPHIKWFGTDFHVMDFTDDELDAKTEETVADYEALGLVQEIDVLRGEVKRFKDMRGALGLILAENLVRPDTILPIDNLPDMFMAVPVWYYWVKLEEQAGITLNWESHDPHPHAVVQYFCSLFPTQRWCDVFQLFNRRVRTLRQYKGEVIPPHVSRRIRKAVDLFDYVVIATPYHDEAGKDWEDLDWLRSIDPYVLGFKKGIPYFFVLARFSDAGTFPLLNELVADTIEFLRARKEKLEGFNSVGNPFWCRMGGKQGCINHYRAGDYLKRRVDEVLAAFEAGNLFDWLRTLDPVEEKVEETGAE